MAHESNWSISRAIQPIDGIISSFSIPSHHSFALVLAFDIFFFTVKKKIIINFFVASIRALLLSSVLALRSGTFLMICRCLARWTGGENYWSMDENGWKMIHSQMVADQLNCHLGKSILPTECRIQTNETKLPIKKSLSSSSSPNPLSIVENCTHSEKKNELYMAFAIHETS